MQDEGIHKHGDPGFAEADAPEGNPSDPVNGSGLDIEKKWLQLAKIDREQFRFFFDRYHDRIFSYLYWRTGDHDLAAELAGETFGTAWRKIDRFAWQGYSFGAWLFRIARGCLGHELRRRRTRRETEFDPDRHIQVDDRTPEEDLRRERDRALIRRCVARLGDPRQDIFVMHYWLAMTVDEMALVLDMPRGTVCSHLTCGRKEILGFLQELDLEYGLSPETRRAMQEQFKADSDLKLIGKDRPTGAEGRGDDEP